MSLARIVALIGSFFVLVSMIGLALWLLSYFGIHIYVFGNLWGLLVVGVIGLALRLVARRM